MEINHDQSAAPQTPFFGMNAIAMLWPFINNLLYVPTLFGWHLVTRWSKKKFPSKLRGKNYLGSKVDGLWTLIGHGPLHISTELVFRILIVWCSKDKLERAVFKGKGRSWSILDYWSSLDLDLKTYWTVFSDMDVCYQSTSETKLCL